MSVQIVQFSTKPQHVGDVEEELAKLFAAIDAEAPKGIEYTAAQIGDGPQFLLTLNLPDDGPNPLLGIPEAAVFRQRIAEWAGSPVPPVSLRVIGRYAN